MKAHAFIMMTLSVAALADGDDKRLAEKIARHQEGSIELAEVQDELAADVQQLAIEQTHPKVIELLHEVEKAMDEAASRLADLDTGGETIAAETDVIEKIFAAAEERQKQSSGGEGTGAMLDMMQRMMGREPSPSPGAQGNQAGDQSGEGMTGDSDTANSENRGPVRGRTESRRVPKSSGNAGQGLPREFQEALDAYNREAGKLTK